MSQFIQHFDPKIFEKDTRSIGQIKQDMEKFILNLNEGSDLNEVYYSLDKIIRFALRRSYLLQKKEGVFRARINKDGEYFTNYGQMWYPIEQTYGRCGGNVFYCSTDLSTAIIECGAKTGDTVTIVQCTGNNRTIIPKIFPVGGKHLIKTDKTLNIILKDFYDVQKFQSKAIAEKAWVFDDFITTLFEIENNVKDNWKYFPTIALSSMFLTSGEAIIYPSVAKQLTGFNFAYKKAHLS